MPAPSPRLHGASGDSGLDTDGCLVEVRRPPTDVGLTSGWIGGEPLIVEGSCEREERYVAVDESGWLGVLVVVGERRPLYSLGVSDAKGIGCQGRWAEIASRTPERHFVTLVGPTSQRWPRIRIRYPPMAGDDDVDDGGIGLLPTLSTTWRTGATIDLNGDGVDDIEVFYRVCRHGESYPQEMETRVRGPLGLWRVSERLRD
jgi:hypothetical protein